MKIKIVDDFVWLVVTDKAKEIFNLDLFELFVVTDDGGEYQILDHDALNQALENGLDIAIEGDHLEMNDPVKFNSFEIKTTAYNEENLYVFTDLVGNEIKRALKPMIQAEREFGIEYDNDMLVNALKGHYPDRQVYRVLNDLHKIEI
jgi:hypothetical protein